ncbi:MAG TPA: recombinase family protein [Ktedonobacteraceae bacterium]|nr:recombinase family protein [Ktedonobacteraceae bacterium]
MQRFDNEQNQEYDYRGKRGMVLLRVSTEEQEKKYGFPSQLRSIREKLLEPRGIRILDEEKYIKRDTYTGMEFQEREVLTEILEMAKRREFDVLVMDVLDRLGRIGLQREIYRAELLMNGVRILTTKPEEHADDDSLMGQMIRLLHGFKSEEERNDIIRRTQNGRRERAEQDHKLLGAATPKYGWKFKDEDKGAYVLDNDPIKIELDGGRILLDENGEPWTTMKVRRYMFEFIDSGKGAIRRLCKYLSSQHIPTPKEGMWNVALVKRILDNRYAHTPSDQPVLAYGYLTVLDGNGQPYTDASVAQMIYDLDDKGMNTKKIAGILQEKGVPTGKESHWTTGTVGYQLQDRAVLGEAPVFVHKTSKGPTGKRIMKKRPEDEWIYLPEGVIPPLLVTEDGKPDVALFERVQKRLKNNKQTATRNQHYPEKYLLRGGYAKCGYCGGNMTTLRVGKKKEPFYVCSTTVNMDGRCKMYNYTLAEMLDSYAWSIAKTIIRNPSVVDKAVEDKKTKDPNAERREYIMGELAKNKASRARLIARLEDEDLDDETYAEIKRRLKELANLKRGYENELSKEINVHTEWMKTQEQLRYFHKRCQQMREKLDDPNYDPDYQFKRDVIEFFGIVARVRKGDKEPEINIELHTPSIVSGIS